MSKVFYIPNGTKNMKALFGAINFDDVEEYYVEVLDEDSAVVATTTMNKVDHCHGDFVRLHFLSYCGGFDAINFYKPQKSHETRSEIFKKSLPNILNKPASSEERINVFGQVTTTGRSTGFTIQNIEWAKELIDSPKVLEEWKGKQMQADSFIPVTIVDQKILLKKNDKEFTYDFGIEYKNANQTITQRQ